MENELKKLIKEADEKLEQARYARYAVISYLEDYYDITDTSEYDYFEDECSWCYGLNERKIEMAIENSKE